MSGANLGEAMAADLKQQDADLAKLKADVAELLVAYDDAEMKMAKTMTEQELYPTLAETRRLSKALKNVLSPAQHGDLYMVGRCIDIYGDVVPGEVDEAMGSKLILVDTLRRALALIEVLAPLRK